MNYTYNIPHKNILTRKRKLVVSNRLIYDTIKWKRLNSFRLVVLLQEPGSEFQYQTSDAGHRKTDSGHQTSEIGHRTLDIRHQASDITHRISNIGNQTSDIGHWTSDIRHKTSDIGHRTSDIGSMSDIWCPISEVCCLMSDVWPMDIGHLRSVFIQFIFWKKKSSVFLHVTLSGLILVQGLFWVSLGLLWVSIFPLLIVIPVSLAPESPPGE